MSCFLGITCIHPGNVFFMKITLYLPGECHILWESPCVHLQGKNENVIFYKKHPVSTWRMNLFVGITLYQLVQGKNENVMFCWNHPVTTFRERMKMSCFVGINLYQPVQGKNENVMFCGHHPVSTCRE